MDEIWRAKFLLGTILTSVLVAVSYEVKNNWFSSSPVVIVVLSVILSVYASDIIVSISLNTKFGRKLILRKSWIEGYWILYSIESQKCDSGDKSSEPEQDVSNKPEYDITVTALAHFSYIGEHFNLKVVTHRLNEETKTIFPTISELATIRSFDLKYSNIYTISDGKKEGRGVARGQFYCEEAGDYYPNMYEGDIVQYTDAITFRQAGFKVPDNEIERYKRRYERDWITPYLCMMQKQLQNKKKKVNLYLDEEFCSFI